VAGKRRERTSIISVWQHGKLVAPLVFQGSCNTEVMDAYFEFSEKTIQPLAKMLREELEKL
jgi:hypothetical protein